jgi:hypothetical protein
MLFEPFLLALFLEPIDQRCRVQFIAPLGANMKCVVRGRPFWIECEDFLCIYFKFAVLGFDRGGSIDIT